MYYKSFKNLYANHKENLCAREEVLPFSLHFCKPYFYTDMHRITMFGADLINQNRCNMYWLLECFGNIQTAL